LAKKQVQTLQEKQQRKNLQPRGGVSFFNQPQTLKK
jgi:hypothetical protein